jgi:ferredoxin-NADP reductase
MVGQYLKRAADAAGDAHKPVYYIAGPPPMVAALHAMLNKAGVDADDLHTEDFAEY